MSLTGYQHSHSGDICRVSHLQKIRWGVMVLGFKQVAPKSEIKYLSEA